MLRCPASQSESGLASPGRRVIGAVSRQRAGTGTAFCEIERVTVDVNKVTLLVQVFCEAFGASFADCACMSGS